MNAGKTELEDSLDFAIELARGAGEITSKYFRKAPETSKKSDGSFVTIADRGAESHIRGLYQETLPARSGSGRGRWRIARKAERRWIVDPIDGTFSFVHGVPFYGVLIGLEIEGQPVLGVINIPALDEIVYAASGLGCFYNGQRTRVSSSKFLEESLLLAADLRNFEPNGFGVAAEALQMRAKSSRTWGDCYGHVLVATGRAEVMLDPVMNIWDCAALLPIIGGGRHVRGLVRKSDHRWWQCNLY